MTVIKTAVSGINEGYLAHVASQAQLAFCGRGIGWGEGGRVFIIA